MNTRHSRTTDEYRTDSRHPTAARGGQRDPAVDDRPRRNDTKGRSDPKRRTEEPMDVDMDDDSDDYNHRRGGNKRTEKYTNPTRVPTIPAIAGRHGRGDRSPPEEAGRTIINAVQERDQPRVRPGSDRDFWIPDAGIEREVITYEITRYLGPDALVRPGKNDKNQNGFLITAFRAPTTEMIRSMKEASEKYYREMQNSRGQPAAYQSSRVASGRDKDLGGYQEREQQPSRRRGAYDSDDSMDDAPPVGRPYDREYERRDRGGDRDRDRDRESEPRRGDRHGRDPRDDSRQIPDPRYQDPRVQDPRGQDPRAYQPDARLMPDPRMQDSRMMQDTRYQERFADPRDAPVTSARHQVFTTGYQEPSIPGYALSPSAQPAGFDYTMAQPRGYSNNTPPPTTRGGQPMYVQPSGYPAVSQAPQIMIDQRTGRQVLVPVQAGYAQEPPRTRHGRG